MDGFVGCRERDRKWRCWWAWKAREGQGDGFGDGRGEGNEVVIDRSGENVDMVEEADEFRRFR